MNKKQILLTLMLMVSVLGFAKELKTLRVTTDPQMVCNNCENKIKKTLRFEKGVHEITTDLDNQVVTVVYDAEKTDEAKLVKAFEGLKYKATVLGEQCETPSEGECTKAEGKCFKKNCTETAEKQCKKAEKQCEKAEKQCEKAEKQCTKAEKQCTKAEKQCEKAEKQCEKAEGECCKNKK